MLLQADFRDKRSAQEAIHTPVRLNPGSARMQIEHARMICHFGNYEVSVAATRKAAELDPHYPKPHFFIIMGFYWLGDFEAALKEILTFPPFGDNSMPEICSLSLWDNPSYHAGYIFLRYSPPTS